MMDRVTIIDASQILAIMRRTGIGGLSALHRRGDLFFFSEDLKRELLAADEWESKNGKRFQDWLDEQRAYRRLIEVKERVAPEEYKTYDLGKRGTSRGGKELSDMSIRKFMLQNKDRFTFELVSRDLELLDNRVADANHPLHGLQFDRLSTRSALTWLASHPDVHHNPERLRALLKTLHDGKFDLSRERGITTHELERETYRLPETYEDAVRERARRVETEPRRRSDIRGLSGQSEARFGGLPIDPGLGVSMSPSGTPLDGRTGGEFGPEAGLSGTAQGALQEGPDIGQRFMRLSRHGAPALVLGLAAVPVFSTVEARATERGITFAEAARELGLTEITEEELKSLAADVGVDLAVTLTPIGPLKKAWDVLGNIDDIVSLMQLYGDAYPENEMIRQMAILADEVAGSAALAAYVEGRDALTGAVGSGIDWVFGSSESEEEAVEAIGKLRGAIQNSGAELEAALASGASREDLSGLLINRAAASAPGPLVGPDITERDLSPYLSSDFSPDLLPGQIPGGDALLQGTERIPGAEPVLPPTFGPVGETGPATGAGVTPKNDPGERKTSYDRVRRIGGTPEEEARAVEEFNAQLQESLIDMGGDLEVAKTVAAEIFALEWGLSEFSSFEEGTVIKHPVEKVYDDLEKDGLSYVREDAEALLKAQGIQASRWYLTPNKKTGSDWSQGWIDDDGYGPRMTLTYDDERGTRRTLTESFQANVERAWVRKRKAFIARYQDGPEDAFVDPEPKPAKGDQPDKAGEGVAPISAVMAPGAHAEPGDGSHEPRRSGL